MGIFLPPQPPQPLSNANEQSAHTTRQEFPCSDEVRSIYQVCTMLLHDFDCILISTFVGSSTIRDSRLTDLVAIDYAYYLAATPVGEDWTICLRHLRIL